MAVVLADELDPGTIRTFRAIQRNGCPRVVMIVTHLDDAGLLAAVEAGVCGILRRPEAVPERVAEAVMIAAKGDDSVPPYPPTFSPGFWTR
ncbi:MAG: hypothetical protein ACR2MN_03415 [Acidimicrobiales bacterium]